MIKHHEMTQKRMFILSLKEAMGDENQWKIR